MKYRVQIFDNKSSVVSVDIESDGYVLLYLDEEGSIKTTGKIETSALTPILAKTLLSKISKGS